VQSVAVVAVGVASEMARPFDEVIEEIAILTTTLDPQQLNKFQKDAIGDIQQAIVNYNVIQTNLDNS
jgi:hypothetical protein